jgi:hypothetical protein
MIEISGFASNSDCLEVISAYERCCATCSHRVGDRFFDDRVLWINSFPDTERKARRILQLWRRRAVALISDHVGGRVYSDTVQVVRWEGQAMPPHQDDRHPDGSPHKTPWRAWASIIYLNDDFDGGEIYFLGTGECYKPVAGSLVFFEGARWHGVRAVTRGVRYTSPSWYATDPAREDRYAGVDY